MSHDTRNQSGKVKTEEIGIENGAYHNVAALERVIERLGLERRLVCFRERVRAGELLEGHTVAANVCGGVNVRQVRRNTGSAHHIEHGHVSYGWVELQEQGQRLPDATGTTNYAYL